MNDSAEGRIMTVEIFSWSISTKVWDQAGIELASPGSAVRFACVLLPTQCSFSKSVLSHENCMSHSMSKLSGTYTYPFFGHIVKNVFCNRIANSMDWLSSNSVTFCTRFSNLFAWCKAWPKAKDEYDQEIPQSHIAGQTKALWGIQR